MLATIRGEMPDRIPFAPRLDLWFTSNKQRGALPQPYEACSHWDEVSRDQGWAIAKIILEFQSYGDEAILDRPLGIYRIPAQGFLTHLPNDVERVVKRYGGQVNVEYNTPKGTIGAAFIYSDEMRRSGVTIPWISEHVLKGPEDYTPLGYIFENLEVEPVYPAYSNWATPLGDDGIAVAYALTAGSPMHHIMKILTDSTSFYYHHRDSEKQIQALAESISVYFRKALKAVADAPAEIVLVGANFDDTITYPPFFRDHILPWLQESAEILHAKGKLMLCHTDGENTGLMDYLFESGMDIADSVCPAPMTNVSLAEYYSRWSSRITILGGIPSNLLLSDVTGEEEFESYLDTLFSVVAPGNRLILGVADTVPPDAVFDRLRRIGERAEKDGRLPLHPGPARPITPHTMEQSIPAFQKEKVADPRFRKIRDDLYGGLNEGITEHVQELLDQGVNAQDIVDLGLLGSMEEISAGFKNGQLFVPEVLLAARAMNAALAVLEPHLAAHRQQARGTVLIGTVHGDLHDIGKNIVTVMLRGAGFDVVDLGINVSSADFVKNVAEVKPDIVGMSALLTTTMPQMRIVIEALIQAGLREKVKVIVGGAPVNSMFAQQIGADGYAANAGDAVQVTKDIICNALKEPRR
jgi:corrinoid protein of di/trimethylamine methyltransferase